MRRDFGRLAPGAARPRPGPEPEPEPKPKTKLDPDADTDPESWPSKFGCERPGPEEDEVGESADGSVAFFFVRHSLGVFLIFDSWPAFGVGLNCWGTKRGDRAFVGTSQEFRGEGVSSKGPLPVWTH